MYTENFQKQHGDDFPAWESHGADMDAPDRAPIGGAVRSYINVFGFFPRKEYTNNVSHFV